MIQQLNSSHHSLSQKYFSKRRMQFAICIFGIGLTGNSFAAENSVPSFFPTGRAIASAEGQTSCGALTTVNSAEPPLREPTPAILLRRLDLLATELSNFQDKVKEDSKGAFDDLIAKDVRGIAFGLEAILYILKKDKSFASGLSEDDLKAVEKSLKNLKELEDAIGEYSLSQEMRAAYQKLKKHDDGFDQFLQNKVETAKANFLEFVLSKEWITAPHKSDTKKSSEEISPRIAKLKDRFESIKWHGEKNDHNLLVRALRNYISSLDTKIDQELEPLIMAEKYTYHELEDGFHEWRRGLRWIPIYLLALKSHFSYQEKPKMLTSEQQQLVDKYQNNKYTTLSQATEGTTQLPPLALYTVAQAIAEIGLIKEEGEAKFDLAKLLLEYGRWGSTAITNESQAEKIIESIAPEGSELNSAATLEAKAHATFQKFKHGDPLPEIVSALK